MAAIGRVLLIPKGDYSGSATYNMLDWVRDNGAAWVCKVDNTVGVAPPTLPSTYNANWQLIAADGTVSGSIAWSSVNNKPFDDVDTTDDFKIDSTGGSNELQIKRGTFGTVRVVSDSSGSPTTTDLEASGDAIIKFKGGSNVTLSANDSANPKEITINSTGGGGGASALNDLTDVTITSPSNDQVLKYDGINSKWVNGSAPASGHTMLPTPNASVDEAAIVSAINTALTEGGTNDDVGSLNTIGTWSNAYRRTYMVRPTSAHPIGTTGIGTWDDESTHAGWIQIGDLKGISALEHDVKIVFNPATFTGDVPVLRGYKIEDFASDSTKNYGLITILFANEISSADTEVGEVGVEITIGREPVSYITPS